MSKQVMEAGTAKSVGYGLDKSKFKCWQGQSVQTGCGAHPTSYSMGTGALYKGGVMLSTRPHLAPRADTPLFLIMPSRYPAPSYSPRDTQTVFSYVKNNGTRLGSPLSLLQQQQVKFAY
jgi:hypothetical protein